MLGVRLSKEMEQRLETLAKKTRRPKSYYVKEALSLYLDEFDHVYQDIALYEEQKKAGTLVTYTLDEIKKNNGLA